MSLAESIIITDKNISDIQGRFDAIIINTVNGSNTQPDANSVLSIIKKIDKNLIDGGLLFTYGYPSSLPKVATGLERITDCESFYLFKYWIACEFSALSSDYLPTSHMGLIMYLKSKSKKNQSPFELNTKFVRIPYQICPNCNRQTKDWGGKKHLLNPLGAAISDIWDFNMIKSGYSDLPKEILERICLLLTERKKVLVVNCKSLPKETYTRDTPTIIYGKSATKLKELNTVVNDDCIAYLKNVKKLYPEGIFDLAFADPPYNLAKNYSKYNDELDEQNYIDWCNSWLKAMYENLRPGGALLVLNIPKWAIHHFEFLSSKMRFMNWIVWDALSTPAGKLLPAHYSLLYFVKDSGRITVNKNDICIRNRKYCLRPSCINSREDINDNEPLTDIWRDIHRIKHKKDRDQHPCQLPLKLMERIIRIFTNEGDLVFDSFGGVGTTAIAAKLLNRNFVITDLDINYVEIANNNLKRVYSDVFGELHYHRDSVALPKIKSNTVSKNKFEKLYVEKCISLNKVIKIEEFEIYPSINTLFKSYSGNLKKLQTFTKRKLTSLTLLK